MRIYSRYGRRIGLGRSDNYVNILPLFYRPYTVMVGNINLVKDHNCISSEVIMYVLVNSFSGSAICLYAHAIIRFYETPLQHKLIYSSILTPYHTFLNNHSIASTWLYLHVKEGLKTFHLLSKSLQDYLTIFPHNFLSPYIIWYVYTELFLCFPIK